MNLINHPLIMALLGFKGNTRACVYTEPLWAIPNNLYAPFITLYMYALGVGDVQIGIILSVGLFFQIFAALFGGIVTDKLGRRFATFFVDFIAWSVPCLIWAFSQNFWWFLVAAIINSTWLMTNTSWQCLLVEDADKNTLVHVYTWAYIMGLLAVFFAPISGLFMRKFSLVPVMRVLYVIAFVSMTVKFIALYIYSTETEQGRVRMKETKDVPVMTMLAEYKSVFAMMLKSPNTVLVLALVTLVNISQLISANFFALYVNQNLHIPEQFLAYFPILRAAIMLLFLFGIQYRFDRYPMRNIMTAGLAIYGINHALLILAPSDNVFVIVVYTCLDAFAYAMFIPRKDSLLISNVDPQERARIMSVIFVIMLGVTSPFGYLAGQLSYLNRRLPFALNAFLFVLMILIVYLLDKQNAKSTEVSEANERT